MVAAVMGWLGTVGTFLAYALLWRGRLTSESRRYAALNVAGGLFAGTACIIYGAWPSAASNLAWAALGMHSMIRTFGVVRADLGTHPAESTVSTDLDSSPLTPASAGNGGLSRQRCSIRSSVC